VKARDRYSSVTGLPMLGPVSKSTVIVSARAAEALNASATVAIVASRTQRRM
jgi:hypothetical protein